MIKLETNVAGVTFRKVDFKSISPSSVVKIVPEPTNYYDPNALKVIIDGAHVGYIKRSLASTLAPIIAAGAVVKGKVKAVVGWNKKNQGIILRLLITQKLKKKKFDWYLDLGSFLKEKRQNIRIILAKDPIDVSSAPIPSWEDFLEETNRIPTKVKEPPEPNYKELYKSEVPFWRRLFCNRFDEFKAKKYSLWQKDFEEAKAKNREREEKLKSYSKYHLSKEYNLFISRKQSEYIFDKCNISFIPEDEIQRRIRSGFLTIYEQIVYNNLKQNLTIYRQINIEGFSFDLLVISPTTNLIWIIEVDGPIHRRKIIVEIDKEKELLANSKGISLIRITNKYIANNLEKALLEILRIINCPIDKLKQ